MKSHYAISQTVTPGTGDYNSDHKTVWQGSTTKTLATQAADILAARENCEVLVFRGKDLGKLVYTTKAA